MSSIFQYSFIYYIFVTGLFLSILFALISFVIVIRRLTFLPIGIEHAAFGGAGLARFFQWDQFNTNLIFCTLLTLWAGNTHKKNSDTSMSLFFSGSMALGMWLLSLNNRVSFNLLGFIFGDLVSVSQTEMLLSMMLLFVVFLFLFPALGKIIFISFDRESAKIAGVNVDFWDTIIYIVIAVSVVMGIRFVGVLLVSVMTILPANFALLWKQHTYNTLGIAIVFSLSIMVGGIALSLFFDIAPGALIALLGLFIYFTTRIYLSFKRGENGICS